MECGVEKRSSLKGRVRRYTKVSASLAGVGARAALCRSDDASKKQAELVAKAIGSLKGPLVKIAQFIACVPDIVPEAYSEELLKLQQNAPVMGARFVRRRMANELGEDWEKKFLNFEKEAFAGASLGQVHRAIGLDGKKLACKLQYPDMETVIDADLRQLKLILTLFEAYKRNIDTKELYKEISDRLYEEIDYIQEAKNIRLFKLLYKGKKYVHVPEVVERLSTDKLITITYLEGEKFADILKRTKKDRNQIAENIFRTWYTPFYENGILHADSHTGNYTAAKDNSINLLDFGCVRVFDAKTIEAVILLYKAVLANNRELAKEAYEKWGFSNISNEMIDVLNVWAKFVYAPFLEDKVCKIQDTNSTAYGKEVAAEVYKELRKFKNISIPREFVFIDRTTLGLGGAFMQLGAELNWHKLFNEVVAKFDVKTFAMRQNRLNRCCKRD
ncbi:MAG: AarF/UbiB family protein [Alphaproteobacteria bacterium]|nr:AarF/UbiB family protein [Alphaproteobacteria bacterium]MCL2504992.1 AarF/UbiB family protein [Alphaproteobacteria bacterium]